ncbi:MAG: DVUA0089 family protein, partial [Hypericibacter sp.]
GQDIIFGDVVNTDHLDASTVTGEGYDALFAQIQSDLGHAPNDQEVLTYIRTHLDTLYEDNDPRGAADHIDAGAGDDTVFAQGGNDTVIGGSGADLLDGGTGNDRIVADAVAGTPDGAVDTLVGGMGSDILVGADGEADYFQWKAGHRGAEGTTGLHAQSGTTFSEGSGEITVTTTLSDPHNIHYFTFEVTGTESQSLTIDLKSLGGTLDSQIYLFKDSNGNGLVGSSANDPLVSSNNNDSGAYGIASDGSTNSQDSFIVQGQLAPGKYILAIGDSTLSETEARSNDSTNGNSNNGSGSGQYQLTITGQNVDLTGGHGLAQGFIPDPNDDTDTVQGFQIGGAPGSRDVLDFSDLLSGAPHTGAGATAANLSSYFDVSFSGGNTILSVDYNGAAGPAGSGFDPQLHVVLQGVSQASWGGSQDETQVLTTLLANGQLTT